MSSNQNPPESHNIIPFLTDSQAYGLVNRLCREILTYNKPKKINLDHVKIASRRGAYKRQLEKSISDRIVIFQTESKKYYGAVIVETDLDLRGRINLVLLMWSFSNRNYYPKTETVLCITKHFIARYIQRTAMRREETALTREETIKLLRSILLLNPVAKRCENSNHGGDLYLLMLEVDGLAIASYDSNGVLVLKTFLRMNQLNDLQLQEAKLQLGDALGVILNEENTHLKKISFKLI